MVKSCVNDDGSGGTPCPTNADPNTSSGATANPTATGTGNPVSIEFPNPLQFSTVEGFAGSILNTLRGIIVILSIIFIILGGIFYITSAGNEKRMTAAKGAIFASVIGLAIGIAAPSFLKEISTILGWNSTSSELNNALSLTQISLNFLNFLLAITGILALIMLIVGGITYLTSAGDEDRIKSGKKIVTYAILGIAISLAAMVIVKQIANLLT